MPTTKRNSKARHARKNARMKAAGFRKLEPATWPEAKPTTWGKGTASDGKPRSGDCKVYSAAEIAAFSVK